MIRQREIARAEAGDDYQEPTAPLPSENDIEEMDIEVPGWEAKGQWVLTLDLITGQCYCSTSWLWLIWKQTS